MTKRAKRLEKGLESLKIQIEKHFEKLNQDIIEKNEISARYHIKEISRSLITTLEKKMMLLGETSEDKELISKYREKLEEFKNILGVEEE